MKITFDKNLIDFAKKLDISLYCVGGYVRNFLIDKTISNDIDLSSSLSAETMEKLLTENGFIIKATYKRTNTVKFSSDGFSYEYTAFRKEVYPKGGMHTPTTIENTDDIFEDARRRDFKCNAVYYDIKNDKLVDPLNGIEDIKNKILDTTVSPDEVFSHDGLRLLRLARFVGELGFTPTKQVIASAKKNADNVLEISKERIYSELLMILTSDSKYGFSPANGHYKSLKLLDKTRVLDRIFPELTLGRNMRQRKDFHKYDVLEHSLKTVLYAEKSVRLYALLHDIGKPKATKEEKRYHNHAIMGEQIVKDVLTRLKAPKKIIEEGCFLVRYHMLDIKLTESEKDLRLFIVENYDKIKRLLLLKQADFMAGRDRKSTCLTVKKWQKIIEKMEKDGTPFSKKDLKITAKDLIDLGYKGSDIAKKLDELFSLTVLNPTLNNKVALISMAKYSGVIIDKT